MSTSHPSAPRVGTVILAGGRVPASLADRCAHRALLPIASEPMLTYVLRAVRATPRLQAMAVVAHPEVLAAFPDLGDAAVPAGDSIVTNMRLGAERLAPHHPTHLLFVTGDLPLITPRALEAYLDASLAGGATLTYPIIPRAASEARFPGAKRTYVRLKDGTYTGGNAIFTTVDLLRDKQALIQDIYNARKQPQRLAGILGMHTVLGLLTGTLTLVRIEQVAARILGAQVRAIITPYPELGFDVDKPEDVQAVEAALRAAP